MDKALYTVDVGDHAGDFSGGAGTGVRVVTDQGKVVSALRLPLMQTSLDVYGTADLEQKLRGGTTRSCGGG